jgi:hypothetical protein
MAWTAPNFSYDSPSSWLTAVWTLISRIASEKRQRLKHICISGTSSSALIYDIATHRVAQNSRMYNFSVSGLDAGQQAMLLLKAARPNDGIDVINLDSQT